MNVEALVTGANVVFYATHVFVAVFVGSALLGTLVLVWRCVRRLWRQVRESVIWHSPQTKNSHDAERCCGGERRSHEYEKALAHIKLIFRPENLIATYADEGVLVVRHRCGIGSSEADSAIDMEAIAGPHFSSVAHIFHPENFISGEMAGNTLKVKHRGEKNLGVEETIIPLSRAQDGLAV